MPALKPLAVMAASALLSLSLSGCSLVVGEEEFACDASQPGAPCSSPMEVYNKTHGGAQVTSGADGHAVTMEDFAANGKCDEYDDECLKNLYQARKAAGLSGNPQGTQGVPGTTASGDYVYDRFVSPRLPDQPIPVRTPPTVMRVWFAPYEDTKGNLIVSGYVYTEITPRQWTIGVTPGVNPNLMSSPLRTD